MPLSAPIHAAPSRRTSNPATGDRLRSVRLPRFVPHALAGGGLVLAGYLYVVAGSGVAVCTVVGWLVFAAGLTASSWMVEGSRKARDRLATTVVWSAFSLAVLPLLGLLWQVTSNGITALDGTFLTYSMRSVVGEGGGIYHAIVGTLLVTAMATAIAVPVGLLTAIYLVEYGAGHTARTVAFLVDVMTGIPSIVAGLFAYALFVIVFGEGIRMGFGGAVALALLMIPLIVRSGEEMLKLVPAELRESSYALGVPKWRTIVKVVLPTAMGGIVTGVTIAVARVIGETAPLLIICGATDSTNFDLFDGRMMTLPVFIYNQYKSPGVPPQFGHERAWAAALVLTIIIMALNLLARLASHYVSAKKEGMKR
ncbi:MAG: phosphate ABC transporter permease PstA [Nocardioidaceae bacterium]